MELRCIQLIQLRGSRAVAAATSGDAPLVKMTCRWLQSIGTPIFPPAGCCAQRLAEIMATSSTHQIRLLLPTRVSQTCPSDIDFPLSFDAASLITRPLIFSQIG